MQSWPDGAVEAHPLFPRAGGASNPNNALRPPVFKVVGLCLAIASGLFIGTSFVLKKVGLLRANVKYNEEAGEGYGYLKNLYWWLGMILMIIGEICNFAAYAFVDAILVTPLGALAVVVTTILSAIFLKERLSFVGKVGCFICIIGSVVIAINAPEQSSAATIQQMKDFVIAPGFLSYAGVVIIGCAFVAIWAGPRYGKKTMMVYLTVCSWTGGLSVVATQGLGAAIVTQASGTPQFNQWFLYVLLVFVIATLLVEIVYLNKALNLYNAALVTPTYYVYFTSCTIMTSAILFRGFKGKPTAIITLVMGFLQICAGVILLQLSKSAKDVPDTAVFTGDLDQVRTVAQQEQPETEPKADAIRGTAAIIRRFSVSRQKMEVEEARRLQEERTRDLEPVREGEQYEWDGIRRRRTMSSRSATSGSVHRRRTVRPPLGMSHIPPHVENDNVDGSGRTGEEAGVHRMLSFIRNRTPSIWRKGPPQRPDQDRPMAQETSHPVALTEMPVPPSAGSDSISDFPQYVDGADRSGRSWSTASPGRDGGYRGLAAPPPPASSLSDDVSGRSRGTSLRWAPDVRFELSDVPGSSSPPPPPPPAPPPHTAKRKFSFQNIFHRPRDDRPQTLDGAADGDSSHHDDRSRPRSRLGLGSRQSSHKDAAGFNSATEEERVGLVKGDSSSKLHLPEYVSDNELDDHDRERNWKREEALSSTIRASAVSSSSSPPHSSVSDDSDDYQRDRAWNREVGSSEKRGASHEGDSRYYYDPPLPQDERRGKDKFHTPSSSLLSSSSSTVTTTSTPKHSSNAEDDDPEQGDDSNEKKPGQLSSRDQDSRAGGSDRGWDRDRQDDGEGRSGGVGGPSQSKGAFI